MLPAKNLPLSYNPIDIVENIFAAKSFEFERRNINEVVIEVQGNGTTCCCFLPGNQPCNACTCPA